MDTNQPVEQQNINWPIIRLQKIEIKNFKSIHYGEVIMDCGRHFVSYEKEKSDILGIYGQNGSGKTSVIDSLSILKNAIIGRQIPNNYAECITKGMDNAHLEFTFDLQYTDGRIRKVVYDFYISAKERKANTNNDYFVDELMNVSSFEQYVSIHNECISMSGDFEGEKRVLKPVIDTSSTKEVFEPVSKQKYFINELTSIEELKYIKRKAEGESKSFIFCDDTISIFLNEGIFSEYFQVLLELKRYATTELIVVDTKSTGLISMSAGLPLFTSQGILKLKTDGPSIMSTKMCDDIQKQFDSINHVIENIIPNLNVGIKKLSPALMKDGSEGHFVELISKRDNLEIPLRDESDGVRKMISILGVFILAFNAPSSTVAIDELDASINEYLLGNLLQLFDEKGKGQLIFTSHNLIALETLNNDYLCFTTTIPDNKFIKLKGIAKTNNLRRKYIHSSEEDESLYKASDKKKLFDSLQIAGSGLVGLGAGFVALGLGAFAIAAPIAIGTAMGTAVGSAKLGEYLSDKKHKSTDKKKPSSRSV